MQSNELIEIDRLSETCNEELQNIRIIKSIPNYFKFEYYLCMSCKNIYVFNCNNGNIFCRSCRKQINDEIFEFNQKLRDKYHIEYNRNSSNKIFMILFAEREYILNRKTNNKYAIIIYTEYIKRSWYNKCKLLAFICDYRGLYDEANDLSNFRYNGNYGENNKKLISTIKNLVLLDPYFKKLGDSIRVKILFETHKKLDQYNKIFDINN